MREKEKLLVTSSFSFSHSVLHSYMSLVHQNAVLCGNGLKFESTLSKPTHQQNFHFCVFSFKTQKKDMSKSETLPCISTDG